MSTKSALTTSVTACPVCAYANSDWRWHCEKCKTQLRVVTDETNHHLPHPELTAESRGSLVSLLFPIIVTTALAIWTISTGLGFITSLHLQNEGVHVTAKVSDKEADSSCDDEGCTDSYAIRYVFSTLDDRRREGTDSVDRDTYYKVQYGDDWPVIYARTNPAIFKSSYNYQTPTWAGAKMLLALFCFYLLFVLLIQPCKADLDRWQQFQKESVLTQGVITQDWSVEVGEGISHYLAYTFAGGEGTKIEVSATHVKVGDPIMVRYLPSNPHRSRPEGW